jgi:alkylation response protein AidB-like acyl-CoA dehydrogenase
VIISNVVYDLTKFVKFHPGGKNVILRYAGQDVSADFHMLHEPAILKKYHARFAVGEVEENEKKHDKGPSRRSPLEETGKRLYGELVPYADASWYQGFRSPYYKDSHRRFRNAVREILETHIAPNVQRWDENKKIPASAYKAYAKSGLMALACGHPFPLDYLPGVQLPGGLKGDEIDSFHELVLLEEVARLGSGGVSWGLGGGLSIGLPPIIQFASDEVKQRVVAPCLRGEKIICLAITEPWAGSDVANIRTEAKKTPDGKHYIVNGEKKWITNGVFADYFTVAVRTGGPGMNGVSLLLLERGMPGIVTKQMNCQGVWASGTTYIIMEDVKVPVGNLIGKENKGFKCIMYNFNHERWSLAASACRLARTCLEDAYKFATVRKTFGKPLINHPVISQKIGEMARQVEASHSWIEKITYNFETMGTMEQRLVLGGPIALMKAQCTRTFEYCAREAVQIMGGTGYTRSNLGARVERMYREVRAYAIPGGSEEIMLQLGVRQALKLRSML